MKVAIFCILACLIGSVISQTCTDKLDCSINCGGGFENHCVDGVCKCLHETPATCKDDDDCERIHDNHEHCGLHNNREWKCSDNDQCYCETH